MLLPRLHHISLTESNRAKELLPKAGCASSKHCQ